MDDLVENVSASEGGRLDSDVPFLVDSGALFSVFELGEIIVALLGKLASHGGFEGFHGGGRLLGRGGLLDLHVLLGGQLRVEFGLVLHGDGTRGYDSHGE